MSESRRPRLAPWPILVLGFVFAFGAAVTLWGPVNLLAWRGGTFPETIPDRPLYQQDIMDVTRAQYQEQPGPDRYFSPGPDGRLPDQNWIGPRDGSEDPDFAPAAEGPWAAAFVSWVLNEVGLPVREPYVGDPEAWLITDHRELADAYEARGAFIRAEEDPYLSPQIGDVIFYDYPWPFGGHVNMVVDVVGGEIYTVGGDELGRVGLSRMAMRNRSGIVGFGATGMLEDPYPGNGGITFEDPESDPEPGYPGDESSDGQDGEPEQLFPGGDDAVRRPEDAEADDRGGSGRAGLPA